MLSTSLAESAGSAQGNVPPRPLIRRTLRRPPRWARRRASRLCRVLWRRIALRQGYERITGGWRTLAVEGDRLRAGRLAISRRALHRAVLILLIYRYCDQERLWAAGSATSALMGILWTYLRQLLRRVRARTGAYRLYWAVPVLWLAGVNSRPSDLAIIRQEGMRRVVASFPEVAGSRLWAERVDRGGFLVMLDSGGFQLWKRGAAPVWQRWAEFVKRHEDEGRLVYYIQPDDPTADEAVNRALLLWAEAQGLTPVPVFHVAMSGDYLDWLLRRGYPVIAIGGHVGLPEAERRRRIRAIREQIRRFAREHVLGALDVEAWSSDCRTWLEARRSGAAMTDLGQRRFTRRGERGSWDWRTLTRINVRYLADLQRRLDSGALQLTFWFAALPPALWAPQESRRACPGKHRPAFSVSGACARALAPRTPPAEPWRCIPDLLLL